MQYLFSSSINFTLPVPKRQIFTLFQAERVCRQNHRKKKEKARYKIHVSRIINQDFTPALYFQIQELEKPPPDPLFGLRIHAWVLVLSGKREVPESFFIEPFTGLSHSVESPNYLGIESVWNHVNYWVNMQDCSEGVKVSLSFFMMILYFVNPLPHNLEF